MSGRPCPSWIVTGGAGFIGSAFVRLALDRSDARLVVVDALTHAAFERNAQELARDPRVEIERADVASVGAIDAIARATRPEVIVHLAAESHVDRSIRDASAFVRTNVVGTWVMLEAARAHGSGGADFRFVQVSTDEVFGSLPLGGAGAFREDSPSDPTSPYAATKSSGDQIALSFAKTYGLPVVVTHGSNTYGPRQLPEKLVPRMALLALDGLPLPLYGDGRHVRDWIHVDDHAAGLLAALVSGEPGSRYVIGARCARSNREVVAAVCDALEKAVPAGRNPHLRDRGVGSYRELVLGVSDRPGHDRRYEVDPTRIESELGWRATVAFDRAIVETVRWYLDHPDWCAVARGAADVDLGPSRSPDSDGAAT